jgi:hypothetical protein
MKQIHASFQDFISKKSIKVQWKPLNVIALGQSQSDNINRMITIAELPTLLLVIGCCFIHRNFILMCTEGMAKCDHLWIVG